MLLVCSWVICRRFRPNCLHYHWRSDYDWDGNQFQDFGLFNRLRGTSSSIDHHFLAYQSYVQILPRKHRVYVTYLVTFLTGIGGLVGSLVGPAMSKRNPLEGWRWLFVSLNSMHV